MDMHDSPQKTTRFRPPMTLLLALCGSVGTLAAGAAAAETQQDQTPQLVLHFNPDSLATEGGARLLYRRLVKAAEKVCPEPATGSLLVSDAIQQCRAQSVARAVRQINDPRLVAVSATGAKRG